MVVVYVMLVYVMIVYVVEKTDGWLKKEVVEEGWKEGSSTWCWGWGSWSRTLARACQRCTRHSRLSPHRRRWLWQCKETTRPCDRNSLQSLARSISPVVVVVLNHP